MSHEGVIESTSRAVFNTAMTIAFHPRLIASYFMVDVDNGCMVFFWHEPNDQWKPKAQKLFKEMSSGKAADYAWEWLCNTLRKTKPVERGDEWFKGGFRVKFGGEFRLHWTNDGKLGPENGSSYAICAVYPTWNEVHK